MNNALNDDEAVIKNLVSDALNATGKRVFRMHELSDAVTRESGNFLANHKMTTTSFDMKKILRHVECEFIVFMPYVEAE
jgi:hypothetical protein